MWLPASALRRVLVLVVSLLVVFSLIIPFTPVSASTFNPGCNVTNLVNNLATAGSNGQEDTINLAAGCTYTLTATLTVNADSGNMLTINGNGATLDGNDAVRVLLINSGANVVINSATIQNGSTPNGVSGGGIFIEFNAGVALTNSTVSGNSTSNDGGGIYNEGRLTMISSTVSGNSAGNDGGGIHNYDTLTLTNSTISGNSASNDGGGIYNYSRLTMISSTVSGNSAGNDGGGVSHDGSTLMLTNSTVSGNSAENNGGGIYTAGLLTLTNSTISSNSASSNGGGVYNNYGTLGIYNGTVTDNSAQNVGGGVFNVGSWLHLNNSIIASSTSGGDCSQNSSVTIAFSLIEDGSCGVINGVNGNLTGEPGLGAQTGNPAYYPLLSGSIAINAGSNALVPVGVTTDQAGNQRIQGGIVDMGTFETDFTPPNFTPTSTPTGTPTRTPPAPDVNLVTNGTFAAGLNGWTFYDSTLNVTNGELVVAPTAAGGGFYQFVNYNSAGEIFEVNFRASNSSATLKALNIIVRDARWVLQYNCVFDIPAFAPFQNYRMRFDTSEGFIPMVVQGALSGNSGMGMLIDDITMVRRTGISVPTTECTVSPPPNVDLVYDGGFNQGTTNWAAFNAAMQVVNIGGSNGNIMELARWNGTPNGGFYQYNPYSAPANGVLQFNFQIGNQSNQSRVINMLVRNPDWTDLHSCFITVPANTPLTSLQIKLKTSVAWSNIVIQGWIYVGDYTGTPPLPFRFDNLSLQYLPAGSSGTTECPAPIPMPQRATLTPSPPAPLPQTEGSLTPDMTATYTATASSTATSTETALPSATATLPETLTDVPTPEPATFTPIPTDTATNVPTAEPPTVTPDETPSPPTSLPDDEGSPTAEVTQSP